MAVELGAYVIYVQADYGDDPAVALYTKLEFGKTSCTSTLIQEPPPNTCSSRDRFAAAELLGKLSQRRGRKALRLNSGVNHLCLKFALI